MVFCLSFEFWHHQPCNFKGAVEVDEPLDDGLADLSQSELFGDDSLPFESTALKRPVDGSEVLVVASLFAAQQLLVLLDAEFPRVQELQELLLRLFQACK